MNDHIVKEKYMQTIIYAMSYKPGHAVSEM